MSVAYPLHVALNSVISEDVELSALGVSYHAGEAPPRTAPPYVVGADQTESPSGFTFGRGHTSTRNLHIWAKTETLALLIYSHLARLLDDTDIDIEGHALLFAGELRLIGTLHDPSNLFHAIAEYRAETKEAV